MVLFFILSFFCSSYSVQSIVFDGPVSFQKNLFVTGADIVAKNVIAGGGIDARSGFSSGQVYLNNDSEQANYLIIDGQNTPLSIKVKNLPLLTGSSSYVVIDENSFLLHFFKPDDPQPTNLVADKIFSEVISGYNTDNLIINNLPGDTTIGNTAADIYVSGGRILLDGEISTPDPKLTFQVSLSCLDLVNAPHITVNNCIFALPEKNLHKIKATSFLIDNLVLDPNLSYNIIADTVVFEKSAEVQNLSFLNQKKNCDVFIKNVPLFPTNKCLLVFDEQKKTIALYSLEQSNIAADDISADKLIILNNLDVNSGDFSINISSQVINFSSGQSPQSLTVGESIVFADVFHINNQVIFKERDSFFVEVFTDVLHLRDNLTPIKSKNFVIASVNKYPYDVIRLTINGYIKIIYAPVEAPKSYSFLGVTAAGMLVQIPSTQSTIKNKIKKIELDIENFKQSFIPKVFQYKKDYCLDPGPDKKTQVKRFGLLVEDIKNFKHKALLNKIITKDEAGNLINYNERVIGEILCDQLSLMHEKLHFYKKIIIEEKEELLQTKKKIEEIDNEINGLIHGASI